jgi:hypothetical protein
MRNASRDPGEAAAMAFRSEDQDYRWSRGETSDSFSLHDTLRELAVTIAGFVGVILLIMTAVKFLQG